MRRSGWMAAVLMVVAWVASINVVNALFEADPQTQPHHISGHIGLALPAAVLWFWLRARRGDDGVFLASGRVFPRLMFVGLALFSIGACVEASSAALGQEGFFHVTHEIGWTLNAVGMLAFLVSVVLALSLTMFPAEAQPDRSGD